MLTAGFAVLTAALPSTTAMVKVGPPLFFRAPRLISAEVFVVAQAKDPCVTRLLVAVEGEVSFTVPLPAKSPPLVLLAMMVLAMLRVPLLSLKMPPPDVAELPERVELVTVRVVSLKMAPPLVVAELPEKVELKTVPVPAPVLRMAPPLKEVLSEMVELETVRLPPKLKMPPPKPPTAVLLERVELVTERVPELLIAPPLLAVLPESVELVTERVPELLIAPPLLAVLPEIVELVTESVPLLKIAAPSIAVLEERVELCK